MSILTHCWHDQTFSHLSREVGGYVCEVCTREKAKRHAAYEIYAAQRRAALTKWSRRWAGWVLFTLAVLLGGLSSCAIQSRLGPPPGHRREVCDKPDGGRYIGALRAGDALFWCGP